nr:autotransporter domain-containing protein [Stenotrophomonas sp. SAM-B]
MTGWRIEPQAQLIWQRLDVDDLVDDIARVRYSDGDSTVGRLGIRLNRIGSGQGRNGGARASDAWLRLNAWHEFNGSPRTEFSSATGYVPFTADVDYTWSFNGDETSWNSKVGMCWNWWPTTMIV